MYSASGIVFFYAERESRLFWMRDTLLTGYVWWAGNEIDRIYDIYMNEFVKNIVFAVNIIQKRDMLAARFLLILLLIYKNNF